MKKLTRYLPLMMILFLVSCGKEKDPEPIDDLFFENEGSVGVNYGIYTNIQGIQKTPLLKEDFDDNSRNWFTGIKSSSGENYDLQVTGGKYIIDYFYENHYTTVSRNVDLSFFSQDFEMETSIWIQSVHQTDADMKYYGGLVWNRNESSQWYFISSFDRNIIIGASDGSQGTVWKKWDNSSLLTLSYNKLTIRKIGNTCYYFVNEKLIQKRECDPITKPGVGFRISDCKIWVDYLYISSLNLNG